MKTSEGSNASAASLSACSVERSSVYRGGEGVGGGGKDKEDVAARIDENAASRVKREFETMEMLGKGAFGDVVKVCLNAVQKVDFWYWI